MTNVDVKSDSREEQVLQAIKQAAIVLAVVTAAWILASVLSPDPTIDGEGARSLLTMPFVAACAAVIALFGTDALAFEQSQLSDLGSASLMAGIISGSLWFVLGVVTADPFTAQTVLHLLFGAVVVTALVAAVGALAQLLMRKLAEPPH